MTTSKKMTISSKKKRPVRFRQRHCHMPSGVLFDVIEGRLSETDLRVAAALGTMSENHWIKDTRQSRIAERCGLRRETVSRSLKRLQEAGWLQVVDPGRPSGILSYLLLYDRRPLNEGPDADEGEAESKAQSETSQGGVRGDAQGEGVCVETHRGGVRQLDHTPCDPSAHTYTNPSSKEESPLPPLPGETRPAASTDPDGPDASADGGGGVRGSTAREASSGGAQASSRSSGLSSPSGAPRGAAGGRPCGPDGPDAAERSSPPSLSAQAMAGMPAAPAVSAGQSPDGREGQSKKEARKGATGRPVASPETTPGPDGLDATAFRTAVRNAVGQERWVARFARLRVVNGWLVCLSWGDAACLWRDFGPVLQAAGVSVIWAEHEQREVKT